MPHVPHPVIREILLALEGILAFIAEGIGTKPGNTSATDRLAAAHQHLLLAHKSVESEPPAISDPHGLFAVRPKQEETGDKTGESKPPTKTGG